MTEGTLRRSLRLGDGGNNFPSAWANLSRLPITQHQQASAVGGEAPPAATHTTKVIFSNTPTEGIGVCLSPRGRCFISSAWINCPVVSLWSGWRKILQMSSRPERSHCVIFPRWCCQMHQPGAELALLLLLLLEPVSVQASICSSGSGGTDCLGQRWVTSSSFCRHTDKLVSLGRLTVSKPQEDQRQGALMTHHSVTKLSQKRGLLSVFSG